MNEPNELKPKKSRVPYTLLLSAFTADLTIFSAGLTFAWTSPVLPKLEKLGDDNPFGELITSEEKSYQALLWAIGTISGSLIAGPTSKLLGRKWAISVLLASHVGGYLLLAFTHGIGLFYAGRVLTGFCVGAMYVVLPTYLGEISEVHNRGMICCTLGLVVQLGGVYGFVIGPYTSIMVFCFACLLPAVLFYAIFPIFIPESPVFYALHNQYDKCEQSLKFLRDKNQEEIEEEVAEIKKQLAETAAKDQQGFWQNLKELFLIKSTRKAFFIVVFLVVLQPLTGVAAIVSYLQEIFEDAGSALAPEVAAIVISLVQVLGTVIALLLVDRLGRRYLLLTSLVGCVVSLFLLGLAFYIQNDNWLPLFSLVGYMLFFYIGIGPLPWTILGESFPSQVAPVAASLTSFSCFLMGAVTSSIYPVVSQHQKERSAFIFWGMSVISAFSTAIIYFVLPETKGKSLTEIQLMFSS